MIFFLLSTAYSWLAGDISTAQDISLSELATDISKGLVAKITVDGDKIFADYVEDGKTIQTKKEVGTALSQTFANLGVPTDKLDKVKIEIKEQSGMGYWLLGLAPFLLPIFFIAFFIWYLTRQVLVAWFSAISVTDFFYCFFYLVFDAAGARRWYAGLVFWSIQGPSDCAR